MIRPRFYHFIALLSGFLSCSSPKESPADTDKPSVLGKWHRFTMANGYTEFDIDSQFVNFYNQKVGRFKLPYRIENDSIKYLTNRYAARITNFGDSLFLQGNDSTTATLYRFKPTEVPFNSIPEPKDSLLFAAYLKGFDTRLIRELEKAGINFSNDIQEQEDVYQRLLKKKNSEGGNH